MPIVSGSGGGGPAPNVRLRGPFQVLETDVSLSLWTPAVGDVIVDIWLVVLTTFTNPAARVEVYTDLVDFFNAGQTTSLIADASTEDSSRRWPHRDWSARSFAATPTVPSVMRTATPVTADILGNAPATAGVAQIWALAS